MALFFRPRIWFAFVAVACAGMLAYALYVQNTDFVDPCPLCVIQRVIYMWIAAVALVAALHNPGNTGRWIYGVLLSLGGITGVAVAGRHLWLQSLPADQVPDCGMGLNYMLDTMPVFDVFREVFYGSGECAEVYWRFLGLSMPGWTFLWYCVFTIGTITILTAANKTRA